MSRLLVVLAVLGGMPPVPHGFAQTPKSAAAPPASVPAETTYPDPLPGLPRPPDAPRSLLEAPPPTPPYSCAPLPGPYFEPDPRLDPPPLPPPGWFTDVQLGIVGPHVKNRLTDMVTIPGMMTGSLHLPSTDLDWTAAPRFEVGCRLPSGFGELAVAYRFLVTDGTATVLGPDAPAALKSRLALNMVDLDYASRAFFTFQWPYLDMKWRFGLRWADIFFDSRADEPFAAAMAGSGIFETRTSNNFWGIGPHAGLELTCPFEGSGLALVGWVDGATLLGRIRQNFFAESTTPGANGQLLCGNTRQSVSQSVPMINAFLGFRWQPPSYPNIHVSAGYDYEFWWNVGRNSSTTSRATLSDQGVLLRAEFNF
jgi:hypothetical protein